MGWGWAEQEAERMLARLSAALLGIVAMLAAQPSFGSADVEAIQFQTLGSNLQVTTFTGSAPYASFTATGTILLPPILKHFTNTKVVLKGAGSAVVATLNSCDVTLVSALNGLARTTYTLTATCAAAAPHATPTPGSGGSGSGVGTGSNTTPGSTGGVTNGNGGGTGSTVGGSSGGVTGGSGTGSTGH